MNYALLRQCYIECSSDMMLFYRVLCDFSILKEKKWIIQQKGLDRYHNLYSALRADRQNVCITKVRPMPSLTRKS